MQPHEEGAVITIAVIICYRGGHKRFPSSSAMLLQAEVPDWSKAAALSMGL